jgi:hypothetical protein
VSGAADDYLMYVDGQWCASEDGARFDATTIVIDVS